MNSLKAMQFFLEHTQNVTRTCSVLNCCETTREGKDYCTTHIEKQPYIQELQQRMKERKAEDERVRFEGSTAANLKSVTAQEMLLQLKQCGTRTEDRLTREIQVDKSIIHSYAIKLNKEGIIKFGRTSRNNLTIILVNFDPANAIEDIDDDADDNLEDIEE